MSVKRNTWQRTAVREALGDSEGFVSAQSLHAALRESGSPIGIATVYRALADLADSGEADQLQQDGEALYRACTPGVHHHRSAATAAARSRSRRTPEAWAHQVAAQYGFTRPSHVVDVSGSARLRWF